MTCFTCFLCFIVEQPNRNYRPSHNEPVNHHTDVTSGNVSATTSFANLMEQMQSWNERVNHHIGETPRIVSGVTPFLLRVEQVQSSIDHSTNISVILKSCKNR